MASSAASEIEEIQMELADESESSIKVKKVVVAGVLGSLSVAVAPTAAALQRVAGWGIALFDPVSLFWIIAFLIGGFWVGVISMSAGTVGLVFFDPTGIGWAFKFLATAPMILIPWLGARRFGRNLGGEFLSSPKWYGILMVLAFLLRIVLMIPLNLIILAIIWPFLTFEQIVTVTITINAFQSLWDALIPYIVVYPTTVFRHFRLW